MKLLIFTGAILPIPGNNTNLISKLIPFLQERYEVHILAPAWGRDIENLPAFFRGVQVHWVTDQTDDKVKSVIHRVKAKLLDRDGVSDVITEQRLLDKFHAIQKQYHFDVLVSTSEPYPAAFVASSIHRVKKILYLMDPPECVRGEVGTPHRNRTLKMILQSQDLILTTPFILDALVKNGFESAKKKTETVGFPMIEWHDRQAKNKGSKIRLLFCGWLCSELRSPNFFLEVVSRLDERFEVTLMGKECELLQERFSIETKANLITLPNQPYDVALQAMAEADVLINIGNSVPVHVPSKTLEYINTGKPMVNFYKFSDCPTLYYTKRYPLALNLFEEEKDMDAVAERFIRYCEENIGKTVERSFIEREYADCTPQYIAQKIIDSLEN